MQFNPPTRFQHKLTQFQFPDLSLSPEAAVAALPPSLTKHLQPFNPNECWFSTYEARRTHSRKVSIKRLASDTPGDLNFQPVLHHQSHLKRFPNVRHNCCQGTLDDVLLLNTRLLFRWQVSRCPTPGCLHPWHVKVNHPWPEVALRSIQANPRYALNFIPRRTKTRHKLGLPSFEDIAKLPPPKPRHSPKPLQTTQQPFPAHAAGAGATEPLDQLDLTAMLPDLIELAHSFSTRDEAHQALSQEGYPDDLINQALDAVRRFQT